MFKLLGSGFSGVRLHRPYSCKALRNVAVVDEDSYSPWYGLMIRKCRSGIGGGAPPLRTIEKCGSCFEKY